MVKGGGAEAGVPVERQRVQQAVQSLLDYLKTQLLVAPSRGRQPGEQPGVILLRAVVQDDSCVADDPDVIFAGAPDSIQMFSCSTGY